MKSKKKAKIIVLCVALSLLIGVFSFAIYNFEIRVYKFSLLEYEEYIMHYKENPFSKLSDTYGKITNATQARDIGKKIILQIYGKNGNGTSWPYIVSYDKTADAWLIEATNVFPKFGACVILDGKNGTVLSVWNQKF